MNADKRGPGTTPSVRRRSSAIRPHSAIEYTADASRAGVDETRAQLKTVRFGVFAAQNPFHGPGRIMYSLPAATQARLSIYDASGRAIRTFIIPKSLAPSLQSLIWDGRDAACRNAAGGIYFYRLESKQDKTACKLVKLD